MASSRASIASVGTSASAAGGSSGALALADEAARLTARNRDSAETSFSALAAYVRRLTAELAACRDQLQSSERSRKTMEDAGALAAKEQLALAAEVRDVRADLAKQKARVAELETLLAAANARGSSASEGKGGGGSAIVRRARTRGAAGEDDDDAEDAGMRLAGALEGLHVDRATMRALGGVLDDILSGEGYTVEELAVRIMEKAAAAFSEGNAALQAELQKAQAATAQVQREAEAAALAARRKLEALEAELAAAKRSEGVVVAPGEMAALQEENAELRARLQELIDAQRDMDGMLAGFLALTGSEPGSAAIPRLPGSGASGAGAGASAGAGGGGGSVVSSRKSVSGAGTTSAAPPLADTGAELFDVSADPRFQRAVKSQPFLAGLAAADGAFIPYRLGGGMELGFVHRATLQHRLYAVCEIASRGRKPGAAAATARDRTHIATPASVTAAASGAGAGAGAGSATTTATSDGAAAAATLSPPSAAAAPALPSPPPRGFYLVSLPAELAAELRRLSHVWAALEERVTRADVAAADVLSPTGGGGGGGGGAPSQRAVDERDWDAAIATLSPAVRGAVLITLAERMNVKLDDLVVTLAQHADPSSVLGTDNAVVVQERLFIYIAALARASTVAGGKPAIADAENALMAAAEDAAARIRAGEGLADVLASPLWRAASIPYAFLRTKRPFLYSLLSSFSEFSPAPFPDAADDPRQLDAVSWQRFFRRHASSASGGSADGAGADGDGDGEAGGGGGSGNAGTLSALEYMHLLKALVVQSKLATQPEELVKATELAAALEAALGADDEAFDAAVAATQAAAAAAAASKAKGASKKKAGGAEEAAAAGDGGPDVAAESADGSGQCLIV